MVDTNGILGARDGVTVVNVFAVLLSSVIAVLITFYLQNRREKRQQRLTILGTLIATRHSPVTEEHVRALNMIDVVFHDCSKVRQLWREYFDMVCNRGLDNEVGFAARQKKNLELITEMARTLGYGKAITHLDMDRVYYPIGLGDQSKKSAELLDELLRVLKGSKGIEFIPKTIEGHETKKRGQ